MRFIEKVMAKFGYFGAALREENESRAVTKAMDAMAKKSIFKPIFLKFKTATGARNAELKDQEYKFQEIRRAIDIEPMLRQAVEKYQQLIWKNGYSWVGRNQKSVDYVKMRMQQISMVTSTPTQNLLDQISDELIRYSNAYLVPQRDATMSGGKPYVNLFGKSVNPISGLFLIPASHVEAMVDQKTKMLVGWKATAVQDGQSDMFFTKDEVIHIHTSRSVGNLTGTPMMTPVLGDVRALRRMEESAEALVFQNAFPLVHYKVGTKESPEADPAKFDEIKMQVESSSPQGMFVTPYDHEVKAVGNGDSPVDVYKYLNYFRLRIISGLGLSSVAFGEGGTSNRSTAHVQDKGLQDGAKKFLSVIKTFINERLISEFLMEGGFDIMNPEDAVLLHTPEVDIDAKIKKEVHLLALFHGNAITEDEMRKELGYDPISDTDRERLYWALVDMPKALIVSRDEAYTKAQTEAGKSPETGLDIKKGIATKVRPTNQNGVKVTSKPSVNKASIMAGETISSALRIMAAKALASDDNEWAKKAFSDLAVSLYPILKQAGFEPTDIEKHTKTLQAVGADATIMLDNLHSKGEPSVGDVINVFDAIRHRADLLTSAWFQPIKRQGEL